MYIHKYRNVIPAIFLVLIAASIFSISTLKVNYLFENYFPSDDEDYLAYKSFRNQFVNDDQFVQIAFKPKSGIFNIESFEVIDSIEKAILDIPYIVNIKSLRTLRVPVKTPLGWISSPVISKNPNNWQNDSLTIMSNRRLKSQMISENGEYYSIHLKIQDSTTDAQNKIIITSIEDVFAAHGIEDFHLGGFINTQVNYVRLLEAEFPFTALASALSMCLILLLLYRSWQNALLPTITVIVTLVLFFGFLGLLNRDLNLTSTLFITIMTIVAVSDIVHLQTYYHKYLLKGLEKGEAVQLALKDTIVNLFLTSATTAIGFLTFLTSSIPHIRTFGLDAGIGVFLTFLIAISLGPLLLYYFPPGAKRLQKEKKNKWWDKALHQVYLDGKRRKRLIYWSSLAIVLISLLGIYRIDTDQYLAGNFDERTSLKQGFNFFEEQFGGIRALEMHIIPGENKKISDIEVIRGIDELEGYISDYSEINTPFSPSSWLKNQNWSVSGGIESAFSLAKDQDAIDYLIQSDQNNVRLSVISEDLKAGRLIAKMSDVGRLKADSLHQSILSWVQDNIDTDLFSVSITGSALLIDKNNESVLQEMINSLLLAFLCVSILMALLFKRIKMIIISLLPNVVPLIAVAGVMGWLKIPLNAATSLIFTIGFVIAIDDTIHFLTRFRSLYKDKKSLEYSIKHTLNYTGKAILHTTIILIVVYAAALFSNFKEITHHAILVAATLVFALLSDFYLIPVLLRQAARKKDLF